MKKYAIVLTVILVIILIFGYQTYWSETYRNDEYGYEIKFPASWKGYKVSEAKYDKFTKDNFFLPTTNEAWNERNDDPGFAPVFTIEIRTLENWNQLREACGEPGGEDWMPGCFTEEQALLKTDKYIWSVMWRNSGPDVMGDESWGKIARLVNVEYLRNNISAVK